MRWHIAKEPLILGLIKGLNKKGKYIVYIFVEEPWVSHRNWIMQFLYGFPQQSTHDNADLISEYALATNIKYGKVQIG